MPINLDGFPRNDQEEAMGLNYKIRCAFEVMVDNAVVEQYDGDLEYVGEGRHGERHYRPLDIDHVRRLLTSQWGDLLSTEAIEEAFERLMDHGEGPRGYCEEDEEERPLSSFRTEQDEAADRFEGFEYDFSLTGRDTTAALRELATAIAAGGAAAVLRGSTPTFISAGFPHIATTDRNRIALLLAWAMQVQHTETAVELARTRRRKAAEAFAQDVGFEDDRWQPFMSAIRSILQR